MKFILLLLSFLFAAITVPAQVNPQCPVISVNGTGGMPAPGQPLIFTVSVKPTESRLTYKWTISSGTIISGQGTETIRVKSNSSDAPIPTATVEVGGVPQECPNSATETAVIDPPPQAENLAQFTWPLDEKSRSLLKTVAKAAVNDPYSQLYIFVPPNAEIRRVVADEIFNAKSEGNVERDRMTFVETSGKSSLIQIWLVPVGATPPKSKECGVINEDSNRDCPEVSVIGPSKITPLGGIMEFEARTSEPLSQGAKFVWTVSAGTIESGQGMKSIRVSVPADGSVKEVDAIVTIAGADSCLSTARETAGVEPYRNRDALDSYGLLKLNDEKARMQSAAATIKLNPDYKLLIFRNLPRTRRSDILRIRQLTDFLIKCGLRRHQFQFIVQTHPDQYTMIFVVAKDFVYKSGK